MLKYPATSVVEDKPMHGESRKDRTEIAYGAYTHCVIQVCQATMLLSENRLKDQCSESRTKKKI